MSTVDYNTGHFPERGFSRRVFNGKTLWSDALEGAIGAISMAVERWPLCLSHMALAFLGRGLQQVRKKHGEVVN